jgi:molybdenum ABC transporter molybdate-binding protein
MEATARDYEKEFGQKVFLDFGPSQAILTKLQLTKLGDLFLPADDSFIDIACDKGLVAAVVPLARMTAVAVLRPGYTGSIQTWADFIAEGHTLGLGNTDSTAIGKLLRQRLTQLGLWDSVDKRRPTYLGTVNDVGNSVQLGSIDVGVVWDAVAFQRPKLKAVHLPELDSVTAKVQIARTQCSTQPDAAMRFVRFLRGKDKGARHFKAQGYTDFIEEVSGDQRKLVVYAGAMLRPAVEQTIAEFEKREAVRVTRVYNGCGILVSQMKTGDRPDLYFACDPRFMDDVQDLFEAPKVVSSNQLVIAVRKGNPLGIRALADLGKPG